MTKDAKKMLKYIVDEAKSKNSTTVEVDINKINNIPNIRFAKKKLLDELELVGTISGYKENILGEVFVYLTSDGLEYFDDLEENKESSSIVLNVSGGQVNIANKNGSIDAVINDKFNERDALLEPEYKSKKGIKEMDLSLNKNREKVFISYSMTSDHHMKWIEELVHRLESDGVQVVIDFKDLELGQNRFSFLDRILCDETIDKILIICDHKYKEKADGEEGSAGVCFETTIIFPFECDNIIQEKIIPVVNEYDKDGKPFLPNYLASKKYVDLTDFEGGYKQLLNKIRNVEEMGIDTV